MTVLRDIDLALDFDEFTEHAGQALRHESVQKVAAWAVSEAQQLAKPGIAYDWFAVETLDNRQIRVGSAVLNVGSHADLMIPAQEACAGVYTVGLQLEEEARRLMTAGRNLEAYLLGEAGVLAVATLGRQVYRIIEGEAAGRGWGVGAELAPGQLAGWKIEEQKLVCSLVEVAAIGVRVNESGMLIPQKSASLVVGIGPGYTAFKVCSPCDFCDNKDTCSWRH
jgi:hypothetical protein